MTKKQFEFLYSVFLRTHVGKLRLRKRGSETNWTVISMRKDGIIALGTPQGTEHYRFSALPNNIICEKYPNETEQEIANRLNRNER